MSRIDILIKQKCPGGVEFKPLWQVTEWDKRFTGVDKTKQLKVHSFTHVSSAILKSLKDKDGDVKLLSTGVFDGFTKSNHLEKDINEGEIIALPSGGTANIKYWNGKFIDSGNILATGTEGICLKYVYYCLLNILDDIRQLYRGSGIKHPDMSGILELKIPIPPIEIQREIVEVLDTFMKLEADLEADLEAELTKRKQQYEHYRDYLLSYENLKKYDKNVELRSLDELGTLSRGRRFVHKDDRDEGIPAIHYGELYTYYGIWADEVKTHIDQEIKTKLRYASNGDVVIVGAGENKEDIGVGVAWLGNYDVAIHDACYFLKHNQNPKFLSYLLRTHRYHQELKKYVSEGKICSVSPDNIGKIKFPIPNLGIQNEIVRILDSFDIVCNDISVGLPAEIEARHKQYEYYRDKLLTFKER